MITKKYLLIFLFFSFPALVYSQYYGTKDMVTLKNGNVFSGRVIEIIPDSLVRLEMDKGVINVFPFSEVKKIEKETVSMAEYSQKKVSPRREAWRRKIEIPRKGLHFHGEHGIDVYTNPILAELMGGDSDSPGFFAYLGCNYRILPRLDAGLVFGCGNFGFNNLLPVLLNTQFYILKPRRVTPFVRVQTGYSFFPGIDLSNSVFFGLGRSQQTGIGGIHFSLGGGMRLHKSERFAYYFQICYKYQEATYTEINTFSSFTRITKYRIERGYITFGVSF